MKGVINDENARRKREEKNLPEVIPKAISKNSKVKRLVAEKLKEVDKNAQNA